MKTTQIRCDVCSKEVFYEDNKGKKTNFHRIIELSVSCDEKSLKGEYCSWQCSSMAIGELSSAYPVDVFSEIAKKYGWEIIKKNKDENT